MDSSVEEGDKRLLGIAPKLFDRRWWLLLFLSVATILSIGVRMNTAKILTQYNPETGQAAEGGEAHFRKPLFLAATFFLGKLCLLPFVGWPTDWPTHLFWKMLGLVSLGGLGGILEYAGYQYLPITIVAMLRVAGLVAFTALGSAYLTRRSTLNMKMGFALAVVVVGVALASYTHISDEAGFRMSAVLGVGLVLLSTVSDSFEQLVAEIVLHETEINVDVLKFTAVSGVFGSAIFAGLMVIAQLLPGGDDGSAENTIGTFNRITASWLCVVLFIIILLSVLIDMIGATALTKYFGATTKESVLTFRIVGAWFLACLIYAIAPSSGFGEEWEGETAAMKTAGGVVIIAGVFFYVQWRREHEEELGKVAAYERAETE